MLSNYFKIAFRNFKKYKVFSLVNIAGLAVGLAIFWLMALYIADELSYDRSGPNASRIYRVVHYGDWSGGGFRLAPTAVPFAPALKKDYSEIEEAARIDPEGGGILTYEDKKIKADDILFADNALLNIFRYPFLYGSPTEALAKPQSIVLTRTLAQKLFGNPEAALNKTILFQNGAPNLVTGVMEDPPKNSHLSFSALRSMPANYTDSWQNFYVYTYVLLQKGTDYKKLEAKLPGFYDRYLKADMSKTRYRMELQPVASIHLHSNLDYELGRNGDIRYVYLFSAVALLVLLIAIINYINLATARASVRVKEVGVRKVIGSGRRQLIALFLSESVLFTFIATCIAALLASNLLPLFNQLAGKSLSLWQFGWRDTLLAGLLFTLLTGLTGGLYPAFFLSAFRTIPALKGQQGNLHNSILLRKGLVTFQFVITISLIAASTVIYQQLHYVLNKDLGFNKEQVLSFHIPNHALRDKVETLKAQLLRDPSIENAAAASIPIGNNDIGSNGFYFEENGQISPTSRIAQNFMVDADYLNTMQIKLLKGRNFSNAIQTDKYSSILVNETLVKELGWTNPIGKRVQVKTPSMDHPLEYQVIGVVKDFNIYSLQHKIEPLILNMPPVTKEEDNCYVRVNKNNIPASLRYIEATYRQFDASSSFEYHFLDENFQHQYESEKREGKILLVFTILAIFIACLGLFGLVTFAIGQRIREIGIRKVLGASTPGIVTLVSKELIRPVALAVLIATPLSWFALQRWLDGFAYRITISPWIFAGAGILAILIAIITVCLRALRAALANPVDALRNE